MIVVIIVVLTVALLLEPYKNPACLEHGCVQSNTSDYCECTYDLQSEGFVDAGDSYQWGLTILICTTAVFVIIIILNLGERKK
jgi:hypothetical protein